MRTLALLALLAAVTVSRAERSLRYYTIGPMLHWNFSGNRFSAFSIGLEYAYWNYRFDPEEDCGMMCTVPDLSRPGYGLALGFDLDRDGLRIYSEPQAGWILAGLSLGPVFQLSRTDRAAAFGLQGSLWANAIAGLDFRYRRLQERDFQSLGLYAKLGGLID